MSSTRRRKLPADRAALAAVGRDLRYWTARRSTAQLMPTPDDTAKCGSARPSRSCVTTVAARHSASSERTRPSRAKGTLSYVSPVARALMNKAVGDVIAAGSGEAEIVEIRS